jgi:hypothetical protein
MGSLTSVIAQDDTKKFSIIDYNWEKFMVMPNDMWGQYEWQNAIKTCEESKAYGYDDWFLPDINLLSILYEKRDKIGGFNTNNVFGSGIYWSSTLSNNNTPWFIHFGDGRKSDYGGGVSSLKVRCVRRIAN